MVEITAVGGRHGDGVGRRGRQNVAWSTGETDGRIRRVFNGEILAGGAAPFKIGKGRLGIFFQVEPQWNSRGQSDNRRWTVNVVGGPVTALALVIRAPHPERAIGLKGEIVIVAVGNLDDIAEAISKFVQRHLHGKGMRNEIYCRADAGVVIRT